MNSSHTVRWTSMSTMRESREHRGHSLPTHWIISSCLRHHARQEASGLMGNVVQGLPHFHRKPVGSVQGLPKFPIIQYMRVHTHTHTNLFGLKICSKKGVLTRHAISMTTHSEMHLLQTRSKINH